VVSDARERWLPVFFGIAACSWMPHWSCHYYRLETASSFVVGSWEFSPAASVAHMLVYTGLIGLSLAAIAVTRLRPWSALLSGILHLTIGAVHVVRMVRPFRFEVFDLPWSTGASIREVLIVVGFGILCLWVGTSPGKRKGSVYRNGH
jgi:hypothetical protein